MYLCYALSGVPVIMFQCKDCVWLLFQLLRSSDLICHCNVYIINGCLRGSLSTRGQNRLEERNRKVFQPKSFDMLSIGFSLGWNPLLPENSFLRMHQRATVSLQCLTWGYFKLSVKVTATNER